MKNKNKPKKTPKKQRAKPKIVVDSKFLRQRNRVRMNSHLSKYFKMTDADIKELEGRLHEIYARPDKQS